MIKIDVGKDFSSKPYGRYFKDGKFSAERFRNEHLIPALNKTDFSSGEVVTIFMDNVDPDFEYSSSFLEETFGGLVRKTNYTEEEIERVLDIQTKSETLFSELVFYIRNAKKSRTIPGLNQ